MFFFQPWSSAARAPHPVDLDIALDELPAAGGDRGGVDAEEGGDAPVAAPPALERFESGVEAEAASTGSPDVDISSARNRSLSFTFLPGEVTHPLTTWVDCEVEEGERAQVAITGVAAPTRYAGRVVADSAVHEVEVGNLTPVPAVPTAAAVLLGAVLAGLGAVRRRRVSRSGSLVLAGILALPAAASAQYSAAEAARTADSTADALRAGAARWRPKGRPVYVVPSGLSARGHRPEPRRYVRAVHRAVVPVQAGDRHRAHRGPVGSHNSGLCQADRATRRRFSENLRNSPLATPGVNRYQKRDHDAPGRLVPLDRWLVRGTRPFAAGALADRRRRWSRPTLVPPTTASAEKLRTPPAAPAPYATGYSDRTTPIFRNALRTAGSPGSPERAGKWANGTARPGQAAHSSRRNTPQFRTRSARRLGQPSFELGGGIAVGGELEDQAPELLRVSLRRQTALDLHDVQGAAAGGRGIVRNDNADDQESAETRAAAGAAVHGGPATPPN